ncbi:MAG: hypothetical protein EOO88_44435, partial [Pedobacter sp.]
MTKKAKSAILLSTLLVGIVCYQLRPIDMEREWGIFHSDMPSTNGYDLILKSSHQFSGTSKKIGIGRPHDEVAVVDKYPLSRKIEWLKINEKAFSASEQALKMPFAGSYTVKFGVQTRGGTVYGEPVTFKVDQMYAEFISDEMWTKLAGGPGEEKTWYLDLDAQGVSRHFVGPMYFYGTGDWWGTVNGTGAPLNSDSWNWLPDWKSNNWIMPAGDYGSMTFDLKGGATVTVSHKMLNKNQKGSFLIDTENKTMRMVDAQPLHGQPQDGIVVDWGDIRIMSLTDNTMQLGVVRDPVLSGEGIALLVFNFISKDFHDNWVPGNQPEPEPPYTGNANDDLTTSTSTKKTWGLSLQTPYNWANLGGEFLNMWSKPEDYTATGWAPYSAATIAKVSLALDKKGATSGEYVFTDGAGNPISGSYTTDDSHNIVFDKNISFAISDWVTLSTTADHKLRVIRTEVDALGNIAGLWLGQR